MFAARKVLCTTVMVLPMMIATAWPVSTWIVDASADVDCSNSIIDAVVVGDASGNPIQPASRSNDPGFRVIARDFKGNPVNGVTVELIFQGSNIRLFSSQVSGTTVNCGTQTLSKLTNGSGVAIFAPRIGKYDHGNNVEVRIDGRTCISRPSRSTDMDGLDGTTGLGDYALFASARLNTVHDPEIDFNSNGVEDLQDLNIFGAEFLGGTSGSYCP